MTLFEQNWYDAYVAWNLNFVSQWNQLLYVPKLLIPSVLCTNTAHQPEGEFLLQRSAALRVFIAYMTTLSHESNLATPNFKITVGQRDSVGKIVNDYSDVHAPHTSGKAFGSLEAMYRRLLIYRQNFWSLCASGRSNS